MKILHKTNILWIIVCMICLSCSISYKFNGASIDYTKVISVSIKDFPNMAALVYPPLSQKFTEELKDKYTRQTKLKILRENGDLNLEGEIINYMLTPQAVKEDAYASQTRLSITIRVRYTNNTNSEEDFEQTFSAYQDFSNENTIEQVQEQLSQEIIKEIIDQIFNQTVANW